MNIKLTASEAKPWGEYCHYCGYPFDGGERVYLWESDSNERVYCSKTCAHAYAKRVAELERTVAQC